MKVMTQDEFEKMKVAFKRTRLPVMKWQRCEVCGRYYKFCRMWYGEELEHHDVVAYHYRVYVCPNCASDGYEAYLKYEASKVLKR